METVTESTIAAIFFRALLLGSLSVPAETSMVQSALGLRRGRSFSRAAEVHVRHGPTKRRMPKVNGF